MEVLFENLNDEVEVDAEALIAEMEEEEEQYYLQVKALIEDASDFEESYLAPIRDENTEFFYGDAPRLTRDEDEDEEDLEGRSSIVSTDVHDVVMDILPSMMRIFTGTENTVEYVPRSEAESEGAKQATDYVNYVVWEENDGFTTFYSAFKDALTVRTGIITYWTENHQEVEEKTFQNIDEEMLAALLNEGEGRGVEMVDGEQDPETGIYQSATLRFVKATPVHRMEAVPPEEFRISRNARSIKTADLVGREMYVRPSKIFELGLAEGIDFDEYLGDNNRFDLSRYYRNPGEVDGAQPTKTVLYGEFYIRIDRDGDGIDELRFIRTIGDNYEILTDEVVSHARIALFTPDIRSHTAIGDCPADNVKEIQTIKTNLIRGGLDSLAQSIFSRTAINESLVNVEDVLNDRLGAVIRTKGDPNATIKEYSHTFVGQQVFGAVEYMDRVKASRTGITEASKGMDPKALQSTALMGIDAIVTGAQERIELIARVFCETGMKELYRGLLREVVDNPSPERMLQIRGQWTKVNPSLFDASMRVRTNPTLGRGTDQARAMTLQMVLERQEMIMTKFGVANPFVTPTEYRNALADLLAIGNIKNVSRYFKEIDEPTMQQIMEAPQEPDPTMVLAQAEMEKVRSQTAKAVAEKNRIEQKDQLDDDFRRDKLQIDAILKAAEIIAKGAEVQNRADITAINQRG